MTTIFDALPGLEVPVGGINRGLARMWEETAASGGNAPAADAVKATQVNFVLHLGFNTTVKDAVEQFGVVLRFSERSPSRVVVLCPLPIDDRSTEMRAKVYGECFLGRNRSDARCCEFVMLSYPFAARQYLEGQLSVCLVSDLPLYYWVHRFASIHRINDYQHVLRRAERILIDTALAGPEIHSFPWPRPEAVRDLACARFLPVRQSIGQILGGYAPDKLVHGLRSVVMGAGADLAAEARCLEAWLRKSLAGCGPLERVQFLHRVLPDGGLGQLNLEFEYDDARFLQWHGNLKHGDACVAADLGLGRTTMHVTAGMLSPEAALSEAMFF